MSGNGGLQILLGSHVMSCQMLARGVTSQVHASRRRLADADAWNDRSYVECIYLPRYSILIPCNVRS